MNTSTNPATLYLATSQTPTWAQAAGGATISGDASMLTNLKRVAQLLTGTIPGTAFPAALSIASSFTVPTINATTVTATSYHELVESTCGSLAPSARRGCVWTAPTIRSSRA